MPSLWYRWSKLSCLEPLLWVVLIVLVVGLLGYFIGAVLPASADTGTLLATEGVV
jgi:hypothetical protein